MKSIIYFVMIICFGGSIFFASEQKLSWIDSHSGETYTVIGDEQNGLKCGRAILEVKTKSIFSYLPCLLFSSSVSYYLICVPQARCATNESDLLSCYKNNCCLDKKRTKKYDSFDAAKQIFDACMQRLPIE